MKRFKITVTGPADKTGRVPYDIEWEPASPSGCRAQCQRAHVDETIKRIVDAKQALEVTYFDGSVKTFNTEKAE